jgi:hypothetical protein
MRVMIGRGNARSIVDTVYEEGDVLGLQVALAAIRRAL